MKFLQLQNVTHTGTDNLSNDCIYPLIKTEEGEEENY